MEAMRTEREAAEHSDSAAAGKLDQELDRLSLAQALQDVDVANGRVIDLTQRIVKTADELKRARLELDRLRTEHAAMRSRRSVRLAERLGALRRALRP